MTVMNYAFSFFFLNISKQLKDILGLQILIKIFSPKLEVEAHLNQNNSIHKSKI